MIPSDALKSLQMQADKAVAEVAADFYHELIKVTPVGNPATWSVNRGRPLGKLIKPKGYSGGQLKTSWDLYKTVDGWLISNNMEYASIIFEGRRIVAGKMYGSKQLPAGLDPILAKYNAILERKLDNIKV